MADEKGTLPPGWDMKFDSRTGKFYYINHYTKTTTWEDPRDRYQQIGKAGVKEKENTKQEPELGLQVANQQVASMRRELESEQDFRNPRSSSPVGGRANTPQMGYAHASLGRLQLDTEHFDSPLPSQRSTLRRDSHILAEISELETNLANQETVNTNITLFLPRSLKKRDNIIPTFFIFFSFIFLRFNVPDSYGCKVKLKMIFLVQHY